MKPKKAITILMLIGIVLFIYYSTSAAPLISDANYTYISGMKWYNTYDAGRNISIEENKPMLVYFWAIWCQYCEKLHTEVYPDPEISKILTEDFVLVAVDMDVNRDDAQKFGVQYPPYLIFFTPSGEITTRIPGYVSAGDLLPLLTQIKNLSMPEAHIKIHGDLPQTRTGPS